MNSRLRRAMNGAVIAAATAGLALNAVLLWQSLRGGSVAGCGGGPCDAITGSRWAWLLGVPVSAFGLIVYLAIIASFIPVFRRFRLPLLAALPGAAAWFVFVQAVFLQSFCPVCNAVHAVGLVACLAGLAAAGLGQLRFMAVCSFAAFLAVGLLQVYGPVRTAHRVEETSAIVSRTTAARRVVAFDGGRIAFDLQTLPRIGPPDAGRVLVECFDYQCAACRTMAGHLDALVAAHPGQVAVILLPVPIEHACNGAVSRGASHPGACRIARTALAVWRANPDAFPAFHTALFENPSPARARQLAREALSAAELDQARADRWLDETLNSNIELWQRLSRRSSVKLPKLLISDRRVLHGLPSSREDFLRVMRAELGW